MILGSVQGRLEKTIFRNILIQMFWLRIGFKIAFLEFFENYREI